MCALHLLLLQPYDVISSHKRLTVKKFISSRIGNLNDKFIIKMECAHLCIIITTQRIQFVSFLSLPCRILWGIDLCFCTLARGTLHTDGLKYASSFKWRRRVRCQVNGKVTYTETFDTMFASKLQSVYLAFPCEQCIIMYLHKGASFSRAQSLSNNHFRNDQLVVQCVECSNIEVPGVSYLAYPS